MLERLPLPSQLGLLALLGSGALLGGAYYFEYVEGLAPCEMCWWQRYPHMMAIAAGLAAVAALAWPRLALVFALVAVTGLLVTSVLGAFHAGVEYHLWPGPQACSGTIPRGLPPAELKKFLLGQAMVRCDVPAWKMWGISMAGWNALLSGGLAVVIAAKIGNWIRPMR